MKHDLRGSGRLGEVTEVLDDALAQKEILLPAPRKRPRWTFDDPGCGDGLAIPERRG